MFIFTEFVQLCFHWQSPALLPGLCFLCLACRRRHSPLFSPPPHLPLSFSSSSSSPPCVWEASPAIKLWEAAGGCKGSPAARGGGGGGWWRSCVSVSVELISVQCVWAETGNFLMLFWLLSFFFFFMHLWAGNSKLSVTGWRCDFIMFSFLTCFHHVLKRTSRLFCLSWANVLIITETFFTAAVLMFVIWYDLCSAGVLWIRNIPIVRSTNQTSSAAQLVLFLWGWWGRICVRWKVCWWFQSLLWRSEEQMFIYFDV